MGQKIIVGDLNVTGTITQNSQPIGGLSVVEINVDINNSSSYAGTLSADDYALLASDNAIAKINFQDTGVTQYSANLFKFQNIDSMAIVYVNNVALANSVTSISLTIQADGTRAYQIDENTYMPSGVSYLTTAPSANNTDGDLKFVVLSSEPATKYDGYFYIITAPLLISFTIDGNTYQAEQGMTWAQWVASTYNTISAYIQNGYIYNPSTQYVVFDPVLSSAAQDSAEIVDTRAYLWD